MSKGPPCLRTLLSNLEAARKRVGLTPEQLEERLILGPGWIRRFETGATVPSIDMLLAILGQTNSRLEDVLAGLPQSDVADVERMIYAEQSGRDTLVHFRYSRSDAQYTLLNSTVGQFEDVVKKLRDGLAGLGVPTDQAQAETVKTRAVADAFRRAVELWPKANPSDLWWFVVYRAYCDPYNHPARFARLDFAQSWKRTGGWALEQILVDRYAPFLKERGVNLFIADEATKYGIVEALDIEARVEADKIDVVLTGDVTPPDADKDAAIDDSEPVPAGQKFFGVVHVKASFAERRTDDVPLSQALTEAGYTSPLWTMDCKSSPGTRPVNRGELGAATGQRSAKRKDIEDEGYFTGCFSYNQRTQPTSADLPPDRRVYVCDFSDPDDAFSQFILARWEAFRSP